MVLNSSAMLSTETLKKGGKKLAPGDILDVMMTTGDKGYFQFIGKDDDYMAGHLIRAFHYVNSSPTSLPDLQQILNSKVKFYAHTRIFEGIEDGLWSIVGTVPIENNLSIRCLDKPVMCTRM
jgi:hypothetical protein